MRAARREGPPPDDGVFPGEDFLLESELAKRLYYDHAAEMPIFDFHTHLFPADIASNRRFENLTQAWLSGDHYKWRAMRANGVPENLITGDADDREKFRAWAATVPRTVGNPLYSWTHLELARLFGIAGTLLDRDSADVIYDRCGTLLEEEGYRVRGILRRMNVAVVATSDDPTDDLRFHREVGKEPDFPVRVVPTFRADNAHSIEDPENFARWLERLEAVVGFEATDWDTFLSALRERHDYFHRQGCRISDHSMNRPAGDERTPTAVAAIYRKARAGIRADPSEIRAFRSAVVYEIGRMDAESGWTMELHFGAVRNVNSRMHRLLGPDRGFDSIGDAPVAGGLIALLDGLEREDRLPKVVLFNLNPAVNDVVASIAGSFQGGPLPGKVQLGAGWWFNDQRDGMIKQMTTFANQGLLSNFIGMLTDSRSFLSFPRHEYFRRVLCNFVGGWVSAGEAPPDEALLGNLVEDICFRNAARFFALEG